ncbi:MAG: hypothetical protein AAF467_27305 [Actinomycetota bacterium]
MRGLVPAAVYYPQQPEGAYRNGAVLSSEDARSLGESLGPLLREWADQGPGDGGMSDDPGDGSMPDPLDDDNNPPDGDDVGGMS